jgi:hypothetical protein
MLLASIALGAAFGGITATAADPELSLTISLAPGTVKPGAEVKLTVVLTNPTDHVVYIGRLWTLGGAELEYNFDVRDTQGNRVPLTRYGRALHGTPDKGDDRNDCGDCSEVGVWIQPHEKVADEVVISKIYELSKPGKYTIQASGTEPRLVGNSDAIKSNSVVLTVAN